jgi:hypothetical protein
MSSRKTAYVATISKIEDIEGKDRIKYISLKDLGWQVIGSSDLKLGEKIVYIEYDTIIAEQPWAEFLRKRCYAPKYHGYKIRAMSMAGKISYGLVLKGSECGIGISDKPDFYDLSEVLHVSAMDDATEYENQSQSVAPSKWQRFVKKYAFFIWKAFYGRKPSNGSFPTESAIKTDETRIQTLNYLFDEKYRGMKLYVTEKIDGQSVTFVYNKGRFIISSRNVKQYDQPIKKAIKELKPGNAVKLGKLSKFIEVACVYEMPKKIADWLKYNRASRIENECLTIQGELAGPGIQKNKLGLNTCNVFIFNLFNPKIKKYYIWEIIKEFSDFSGIPTVPFKEYTSFTWNNVAEMEAYVMEDFEGSLYPKDQPREGLVFRAITNFSDLYLPEAAKEQNGCFSWKCINPKFVLNNNE